MIRRLPIGLIVLSMMLLWQAADAYTLKSLDASFPVISGVLINRDDAQKGMDFHATLMEPVAYQGMVLPEGTQFVGHVSNVPEKGSWRRAGRLEIWFDQVVFTNGERYTIYPYEQPQPHLRFSIRTNGRSSTFVDAGDRIFLQFNPATMKGILQMAQQN
jgi:hypothetical protein